MTINTLIELIGVRVQELADMEMDTLRSVYPEATETRSQLVKHVKDMGLTRGQIIRDVIFEEFCFEDDQELPQ